MPPNSSRIAKLESGHAVLHEQMLTNTDLLKTVAVDVKQIGTQVTTLSEQVLNLKAQKSSLSAWAMAMIAALVGALGGILAH